MEPKQLPVAQLLDVVSTFGEDDARKCLELALEKLSAVRKTAGDMGRKPPDEKPSYPTSWNEPPASSIPGRLRASGPKPVALPLAPPAAVTDPEHPAVLPPDRGPTTLEDLPALAHQVTDPRLPRLLQTPVATLGEHVPRTLAAEAALKRPTLEIPAVRAASPEAPEGALSRLAARRPVAPIVLGALALAGLVALLGVVLWDPRPPPVAAIASRSALPAPTPSAPASQQVSEKDVRSLVPPAPLVKPASAKAKKQTPAPAAVGHPRRAAPTGHDDVFDSWK